MAFINASLLLGVLLAAVPIVLHLVMRQQPKRLVFPALRFLEKRRETNRRKLQLRHWLLLALRCAAVALLALALARPSVSSAALGSWLLIALLGGLAATILLALVVSLKRRRGKLLVAALATAACVLIATLSLVTSAALKRSSGIMLGQREAPVSAVLVFDTAPRMLYRYQNETRLEAAQETGSWLIGQFPADSQIAVLDAHPGPTVFSVDLAAADKAVQRLQPTGAPDRLPEVLDRALRLVSTSRHARKEIYVFTDMAAASWQVDVAGPLHSVLQASPDIALYVIDVGIAQPSNLALGQVQLSAQSLANNHELVLQCELRATGVGGTKVVELYLEQPDAERPVIVDGQPLLPIAQRRGRQEVSLADDGAQRIEFRLAGIPPGVHQGRLAVSTEDGLEIDNTRYFAVEVKDAWSVLVAGPPEVNPSFLTEAISPYEYRRNERARFVCTTLTQNDLANRVLGNYAIVCLVDPAPLPPTVWEQLGRFVKDGGALAIFLGHKAQPVTAFNTDAAQRLLGGTLKRQWRAGGRDLFLAPQRYDHPVLASLREQSTSVPWNASPVFRHWVLDPLTPEASTVIPFGNAKPALVETAWGKGRVMTMTTPISDPSRPRGRIAWNELLTSEESWPSFVLVNEIMRYLASAGENQLNYLTGQTAVLTNDPDEDPQRYQLFTPLEEPQELIARDGRLSVKFTERPGAYRLKGHRGGPVIRGFAVNLPVEVTELERLARQQLDELLGEERYQLARSRDEIVREVGETRVGREFYPYLIAILAVVLALEHLLANRFYRFNDAAPGDVTRTSNDGKGTSNQQSTTVRPKEAAV